MCRCFERKVDLDATHNTIREIAGAERPPLTEEEKRRRVEQVCIQMRDARDFLVKVQAANTELDTRERAFEERKTMVQNMVQQSKTITPERIERIKAMIAEEEKKFTEKKAKLIQLEESIWEKIWDLRELIVQTDPERGLEQMRTFFEDNVPFVREVG